MTIADDTGHRLHAGRPAHRCQANPPSERSTACPVLTKGSRSRIPTLRTENGRPTRTDTTHILLITDRVRDDVPVDATRERMQNKLLTQADDAPDLSWPAGRRTIMQAPSLTMTATVWVATRGWEPCTATLVTAANLKMGTEASRRSSAPSPAMASRTTRCLTKILPRRTTTSLAFGSVRWKETGREWRQHLPLRRLRRRRFSR